MWLELEALVVVFGPLKFEFGVRRSVINCLNALCCCDDQML